MKQTVTLTLILFIFTTLLSAQSFLSVEYLGSRTPADLAAQFFNQTSFEYHVNFYRVTYETRDLDDNTVTVSGLLVLPDDPTKIFPVACYMHGTSGSNQDVPSQLALDADLPIALAAKGYVAIAPDYLGLGIHEGIHPFVHAASEAWVGVDMIRALRNYVTEEGLEINEQLFITGYSQGGHAGMALHRELETQLSGEFTVTAAAHMSGPYSIAEVMRGRLLSDEPYTRPGYLINTMISYQFVYGDLYSDISEAIRPAYQDLVQDFSEEIISLDVLDMELSSLLEANEGAVIPSRIFQEAYIQAIEDDPAHPANLALLDNNVYDWAPESPTRLYYCEADEQIPFENSLIAESTMTGNGAADVEAININSLFNHFFCAFPASIATADFFAEYQEIGEIPLSTAEVRTGELRLSPNPAGTYTSIPEMKSPGDLYLYDLSGRLMVQRPLQTGRNTLSLEGLNPGIYMAKVIAGDVIYTERLVVNQ